MKKDLLIMGIETSCDETAVAIIKNGREIIANVVASQIESHKRFGGVVPEIASRHHVEQMTIVLEEAMNEANDALNATLK
jgi:N6-L-threonylcarbamoyladenine synthase